MQANLPAAEGDGAIGGAGSGERLTLGPAGSAYDEALALLERERAVERIWAADAGLWSDDPGVREKIADRLGWLTVAERMRTEADDLLVFGREIRDAGFERVVVLGMGGSSLCVEVLRLALGSAEGFPQLAVLDTTDPATIRALEAELDLAKTLFIVASKSGGTLETLSHATYFFERVTRERGDGAGANFIAITDPGSQLERLAGERGYRRVFLNPADIGGRYSVLSYFGLVPAALAGINIATLLDRALAMMDACRLPAADNPGARLGALMGGAARAGRDKLTLIAGAPLLSFGDWAEQLIAESTGKEGRGVVPVVGLPLGDPAVYGDDRVFVHLYLRAQESGQDLSLDGLAELEACQPVARLDLADRYDLGAEFFRWEFATALAGKVLGSNPFDEPNVQESKDNTNRLLDEYAASGRLPEPEPGARGEGLALVAPGVAGGGDLASALGEFLGQIGPGDYVALQAYFAATPEVHEAFRALRVALRDRFHVATTLGYGPRFLHSTGQLHKGGANNGVFLQFVAPAADGGDLPIPGKDYGFGTLKAAQALGDFQSLQAHGRRAARVVLGEDIVGGLRALTALV